MLVPPCGRDCESCDYTESCDGCYAMEGRPFYIADFGMDICPVYDCSVNKRGYKSCAECPDLPCQIIHVWKDPSVTDEAHINSINDRVAILKNSRG